MCVIYNLLLPSLEKAQTFSLSVYFAASFSLHALNFFVFHPPSAVQVEPSCPPESGHPASFSPTEP
jgi:hypothetical protein